MTFVYGFPGCWSEHRRHRRHSQALKRAAPFSNAARPGRTIASKYRSTQEVSFLTPTNSVIYTAANRLTDRPICCKKRRGRYYWTRPSYNLRLVSYIIYESRSYMKTLTKCINYNIIYLLNNIYTYMVNMVMQLYNIQYRYRAPYYPTWWYIYTYRVIHQACTYYFLT